MKVWNFKKQGLDEGVEPPVCNGISGKDYDPVYFDFGKTGEIEIAYSEKE